MVRRRQSYRGRIAETRSVYQSDPDVSLPSFASTPDEIQPCDREEWYECVAAQV